MAGDVCNRLVAALLVLLRELGNRLNHLGFSLHLLGLLLLLLSCLLRELHVLREELCELIMLVVIHLCGAMAGNVRARRFDAALC